MAAISYPGSRSFSLGVVRSVNKSVHSGALNRGSQIQRRYILVCAASRMKCRKLMGIQGKRQALLLTSYRDYFVAHRIVNKLGQRMESKLQHDVAAMSLRSPDRDSELR